MDSQYRKERWRNGATCTRERQATDVEGWERYGSTVQLRTGHDWSSACRPACCNMELPLLLTTLGGEECRAMALPTGCTCNSHAPCLSGGQHGECRGVLWSELTWILFPDTLPSCKITLTMGNSRKSRQVLVIVIHDASETRNLELYSWKWVFACKDVETKKYIE